MQENVKNQHQRIQNYSFAPVSAHHYWFIDWLGKLTFSFTFLHSLVPDLILDQSYEYCAYVEFTYSHTDSTKLSYGRLLTFFPFFRISLGSVPPNWLLCVPNFTYLEYHKDLDLHMEDYHAHILLHLQFFHQHSWKVLKSC